MKFFLDSADINEIKRALDFGVLDGVTTNPSLIKEAVEREKSKGERINLDSYIRQMLKLCKGKPVSLEVISSDYDNMLSEAETIFKKYNKVAKNVYVKIPVNPCMDLKCTNQMDGIRVIRKLSEKNIPVNCTLIFTPEQALLAAKAGANFVSPFVGRIDDYLRETAHIKFDKIDYFPREGWKKGKKVLNDNGIVSGVELIKEISVIFKKQNIKSEILAASIRNTRQIREVAEAGADIATIPFNVFGKIAGHIKTVEGMKKFTKDVVPEYAKLLGAKYR
ncbi:transaldolase [Candidatus Pacearchaeota archaeon CG10_big_fil_rev_8_21_14_0_10_31_9]|nr:MAG: transaldolase [Candidatus Pacearchaeota archaeon CG10_big_fil_rev_8_21_14_0_10_31_9]PIZ82724.1 MAG: transaldolase [Candidatus Pacearchaeota archaeon CG_4_10_14_0_2_um_filter_05_32_18]